MKTLFLILAALSCSLVTAKPHHIPPHAKICQACDGHGSVRTWKKAWFGRRACRACNGKGFFALPKPPPPPPKAHRKPPHKPHAKPAPKPHHGRPAPHRGPAPGKHTR